MNASEPVALITPAGTPIGRALAQALARAGLHIAAHDLNPLHLEDTLAQVRALGRQARAYSSDIVKKMPAQMLINHVTDDFGRLDVLVIGTTACPSVPLLDLDEWDWHRTLDMNLTSAFLLTQVAGRVMRAQGSGVILLRCDLPPQPTDGQGAYRIARAGVVALMQSAAQELAPGGVRVFGFVPADSADALPLQAAVSAWLASDAAARVGQITPIRFAEAV